MKMFSVLLFLTMSFATFANEAEIQLTNNDELDEFLMHTEEIQWKGCMAVDSNYQPYWGRTAEQALKNCRQQSQIGDCKISRCK